MAGRLSFTRDEAAALPLTPEGVARVIAEARARVQAQLGLATAASAALLLASRMSSGGVAMGLAGLGFLSLWGVLATALSAWDHARVAAHLRKHAATEIARQSDPVRFWRAHRGLFPFAWS